MLTGVLLRCVRDDHSCRLGEVRADCVGRRGHVGGKTATGQQEKHRRRIPRPVRPVLSRALRAGRLSRPLCPGPLSRLRRTRGPLSSRTRVRGCDRPGPLSRAQLRAGCPLSRAHVRAGPLPRALLPEPRDHGARVQTSPSSGRLPVGGEHVPDRHHGGAQAGARAGGSPGAGAGGASRSRRGATPVPGAGQPSVPGDRHQTGRRAGRSTVPGHGVQTVPGAGVPSDSGRGAGPQARRHRRAIRRQVPGRPGTVAGQVSGATVLPSRARVRAALPPDDGRLPDRVALPGCLPGRVLSPTVGGAEGGRGR